MSQSIELSLQKEQSYLIEKLEAFRQIILDSNMLRDNKYGCSELLDEVNAHIKTSFNIRKSRVPKIGNN